MSPDGQRVIMSKADWTDARFKTAELAGFFCEGCVTPHPVPFNKYGESHHRLGRGGGRREDRPLVPMQTIETQPNLALWRWWRGLQWTCQIGHEILERKSTKEFRHSLKRYCECGLLKF